MDDSVQSFSSWNFLPRHIIWKLFSFLSPEQQWKASASSLKFLNKHWCDAVRGYATTLKPRNDGPFSLAHDFKTVYQKFENLEVAVIEDVDADDVPGFDGEGPNLKWLRKMKMSNARMDSASGLLSHSPYLSHLSLENPRFPLSAVWDCLVDQTSLKWLQLSGDMAVASDTMTPLDLPHLERLDIAHVTCPPDCLPLLINRCPELQVLRIGVHHLSETNFETLHGMKKLTSLVLDGVLEDNVFDPSSFPLLKHLVFSCHQIPLKLGRLSQLTSLGLGSRDKLENEQTLTVLYDLISHLDQLKIHLPAAKPSHVSDVLSYGERLTTLKIKNYHLSPLDADWMQELRCLEVLITVNLRRKKEHEMLKAIKCMPRLTSLKIRMNNSVDMRKLIDMSFHQLMKSRLTHVALHNTNSASVKAICLSGWPICELHISKWIFEAIVFYQNLAFPIPTLRNLCFSNCTWCTSLEKELKTFIEWHPFKQLEHLALPPECFHPNTSYLIDELRNKAPGLQVDDNPDWPMDQFKM